MSNLIQEFEIQELANLNTPPAVDVSTLTVKQNNSLSRHHPLRATTLTDGDVERHPNASSVLGDKNHHVKPPNTLAQNDYDLNNHSRPPLGNLDANTSNVRVGDQAIKEKSDQPIVKETQVVKGKRALETEELSSVKRQRIEDSEVKEPMIINHEKSVPWNPLEFPPPTSPETEVKNYILFETDAIELSTTDHKQVIPLRKFIENSIRKEFLDKSNSRHFTEEDLSSTNFKVEVINKLDKKIFDRSLVKIWFSKNECARAFMGWAKKISFKSKDLSIKSFDLYPYGHGQCHSNQYLTISMKPKHNKKGVSIERYTMAIEKWLSENSNFTFKGAWRCGKKFKSDQIEYEDQVWFTIWRKEEIHPKDFPNSISSGNIEWSTFHPDGTGEFEITFRGKEK